MFVHETRRAVTITKKKKERGGGGKSVAIALIIRNKKGERAKHYKDVQCIQPIYENCTSSLTTKS